MASTVQFVTIQLRKENELSIHSEFSHQFVAGSKNPIYKEMYDKKRLESVNNKKCDRCKNSITPSVENDEFIYLSDNLTPDFCVTITDIKHAAETYRYQKSFLNRVKAKADDRNIFPSKSQLKTVLENASQRVTDSEEMLTALIDFYIQNSAESNLQGKIALVEEILIPTPVFS